MLRTAWRSVIAHKLRLLLSTFAITLAVAFVSGSFIFTDLLSKAITEIELGLLADVNVVKEGAFSGTADDDKKDDKDLELTDVNISAIKAVAGVKSATGVISVPNVIYPIAKNGRVLGTIGASSNASNWFTAPSANNGPGLILRDGSAPKTTNEVVVDPETLKKSGYKIGDEMQLLVSEKKLVKKIVGTAEWGDSGGEPGASYLFFNDAEAQTLFTRGRDIYLYVWVVAEPNTDVEKLAERISTVIPDGFEAVSGKKATEQVGSQVSEALGFFNQFLLVFAAISVLVSSFLIVNTFNILVAQRARELALLRAIGAKRRQVRLVVLVEAIIIGLIAGSLGLLLGLGLVWLIEKIFVAYELLPKPVTPTINSAAVIASYSVGLIVTLFSALLPAIRASRVPPVAAMTGQGELDEKNIGKIGWFGLVLLIVGLITVDVGGWLQSDITWWLIGGGALLALIGTAFSAALLGAPIVWLLGKIFGRTHGEIAVLAKRNVTRQPRRLASTSSSLIIGLALVSTIAVIGSSAEKTIAMKVTENIRGDLQVASVNFQPFDAVFADEIEKISGATTHRMKIAYTLVGKDYRGVMGLDEGAFNKVLAQELVEGSFPKGENEALINELWVDDFDGIGSEVTVNNPKGPKHNLKIVGVFKNSSGMRSGLFMVNPKTFAKLNPLNTDLLVTLEIKPDGDLEKVRSEIEKIIEEEPTLTVTNNDEFVQLQLNQLNQVLWLVYGLLGLALIISILGIVNTLVLAVIERTREIGLMRAIGLTRSQLRRTIRLEAIMITVLGSVVGIGLGLFFGIVIRAALRNDGLTELEIPVVQLVIFLVVTAFIGMLAATWPARRAAKQNILAAIATE